MISFILTVAIMCMLAVIAFVVCGAAVVLFAGLSVVVAPLVIIVGIIWLFKAFVNVVL
jgi:hypothetical protein